MGELGEEGEPIAPGEEEVSVFRLVPQEAQKVALSSFFAPHLGQNTNVWMYDAYLMVLGLFIQLLCQILCVLRC